MAGEWILKYGDRQMVRLDGQGDIDEVASIADATKFDSVEEAQVLADQINEGLDPDNPEEQDYFVSVDKVG